MLKPKDMINELLYGFEVFLGVYEMSWDSSKLQMAGELIYIGLQVELVFCRRWPVFYVGIGTSGVGSSELLVTHSN